MTAQGIYHELYKALRSVIAAPLGSPFSRLLTGQC